MEKLEIEIFLKLRELMDYPEEDYVRDSVDTLHQALSMKFACKYIEAQGYDIDKQSGFEKAAQETLII